MNILIVGSDENFTESQLKFGKDHDYIHLKNRTEAKEFLSKSEVIFDFTFNKNQSDAQAYSGGTSLVVFVDTSKISLIEIAAANNHKIDFTFFGFCGLTTFLNRPVLEACLYQENDKQKLNAICGRLNTSYAIVADRVGLATPRIVSMIINEAYYTVQEGTASREDIDLAMKLGTNYPFGPFEWAKQIGVVNLVELLEAVYEDTRDERYKICPLLKKERLSLV
jgi:3-hydroxybutyryl-CoA dehydrogenase